jgi:DNA-binding transcriptional MerR regulator
LDKSPDAFRTISEVAADLDLPQHVLRFWETRFVQIRPLKRGGGRRYYRPDDVELLKGIRHLLYGEGYTIRGVQRILKEQGVRFVMNVWLEGAPQPPKPGTRSEPTAAAPSWEAADDDAGFAEAAPEDDASPPRGDDEGWSEVSAAIPFEDEPSEALPPVEDESGAREIARRFAPHAGAPSIETPAEPVDHPHAAPNPEPVAAPSTRRAERPVRPADTRTGIDRFMDRLRSAGQPEAGPVEPPAVAPGRGLTRDEIRRLQATLFELLECKRLLDQER